MKGNQGLEALAALCGGQSDAPTDDARASSNLGSLNSDTMSGTVVNTRGTQQAQPGQDSLQCSRRQAPLGSQQSSLLNVTPQQWQQALAAAAALQGSVNPALAAQSLLMSAGLTAQQGIGENAFSAMQQLALHQYIQAQAKVTAQKAAQTLTAAKPPVSFDQNQQALMFALAAGKAHQLQQGASQELNNLSQQQVIPSGSSSVPNQSTTSPVPSSAGGAVTNSPSSASMKPPPPPSQVVHSLPSTLSTAGIMNQTASSPLHTNIAPMPCSKIVQSSDTSQVGNTDDKKQLKRAANRRSAQLSRKRKKQFIEELKEENDELRRKEQILRSIPDLIVVFDSSGKLGFVSQSVSRFLDMSPEELEGTSFWSRLCEDSVRLLKAAFMDSLAAKKPDSDTAPLGSGVWELRLVGKDSNYIVVTLNGVVHFTGDAPECVCCIRPRDQQPIRKLPKERIQAKPTSRTVSSSDGSSRSSDGSHDREHPQIRVDPSQSVMSNDTSADDSENNTGPERKQQRRESGAPSANARQVVRISDGDSGCEVSESGSDDGIGSNDGVASS